MRHLNRWVGILYFAALLFIVAAAIVLSRIPGQADGLLVRGEARAFGEDWEITQDETMHTLFMKKNLPENLPRSSVLHLSPHGMAAEICIDSKRVKTYGDVEAKGFDLPLGKAILLVRIPDGSAGKEISIRLMSAYKIDPQAVCRSLFIGEMSLFMPLLLWRDIPNMIFSTIYLALGLICIFMPAFFAIRKKKVLKEVNQSFLYLGSFIILAACWAITDSSILQWFTGNISAVAHVSFLLFMLIPVPFILFVRQNKTHCARILDVLSLLLIVNFAVCSALHFLRLIPLAKTIVATHALLLSCVLVLLVVCIREVFVYRNREMGGILAGLILLALTCVAAIAVFYIYPNFGLYSAVFQLGLFGFILSLGSLLYKRMESMLQENMKTSLYRKFAYIDTLTGLGNRRAFEEEQDTIQAETERYFAERLTYVLMDINDLKRTNDHFGHAEGDRLIKRAAVCIEDAFRSLGVCYRVGGDEFVIIIHRQPQLVVDAAFTALREAVEENNDGDDIVLELAHGYAVKQKNEEFDAEAMYRIADRRMYEDKAKKKLHSCV